MPNEVVDPYARSILLFKYGLFSVLCVIGVFGFYLAPSDMGRLDQIYSLETTIKTRSKSSMYTYAFLVDLLNIHVYIEPSMSPARARPESGPNPA